MAATPIGRDITLQALYGGTPPLSAYPTKDRNRIEKQQEELDKLAPGREITRRNRA
jgi:penicillin-binding protein 2